MQHRRNLIFTLLFMLSALPAYAEDCPQADQLVRQAYDLGDRPAAYPEQTRLLQQALALCPAHAEAHNNLGWVLEQQGALAAAAQHYQQAAQANPQLANAWVGLGRVYERTQQLPLALEAYLHACQQKPEARTRITALLADGRYQAAADGTILDRASLLLLFNRDRRTELNQMLDACRLRSGDDFGSRGIDVEPVADFPNILFDLGKATLQPDSGRQIAEIGAALKASGDVRVIVSGHTDKQPFEGVTDPAENLRRNMKLSEDRAAAVADELARLGVPRSRIATHGYGPTQPAIDADTLAAYARNRRVVVAVQ